MKRLLIALLALILIAVAAVGIAVATFDINKFRPQIEAALTQKTGRTVKLNGEIHLGVSSTGITLSIQDASIGNPPGASRPLLASLKKFDLQLGLMPLLEHKVDISGISIENADILLEKAGGNHNNWDLQLDGPKPVAKTPEEKVENAKFNVGAKPIAFNISKLAIKNSKIAMRDATGKITTYNADSFTLAQEGKGVGIHFDGSMNDFPIKLAVQTDAASLLSQASRPVDIDLTFANYHLTAKGKVDLEKKRANFDSYELTAGDTKLAGKMAMEWGGARPVMQGTLLSDKFVPSDLKLANPKDGPTAEEPGGTPAEENAPQARVFSDKPIAFDGLKAADMDLDVAIKSLPVGSVELQALESKLVNKDGHLFISPLKMALGNGSIDGQINLDATDGAAKLSTNLKVADVDYTDFIKMWGTEAFLSGKVNMDYNLVTTGRSAHELASNLSGTINMISAGGDVISTAKDKIAAGISNILSPGSATGNEGMNCLVGRFIAQNGVVKPSGLLIDTSAATAAGYGDIDLRGETLNLDFHAKSKFVNIGGFLPTLHIGGTLLHPDVGANGSTLVQNATQLLMGGTVNDGVPDVMTQNGQNACAYALDHPASASSSAAPASKGGVVQDLAGKAGSMLKGLLGK